VTTQSPTRLAPRVRDPARPIWTIAGVCWVATLVLEVSGAIEAGHHDVVLDGEGPSSLVRVAGFLLVWTVMVGAMMLPTMIPMARLVHAVTGPHAHAVRERTGLYAAYLAVWMLFGVAALAFDSTVHWMVEHNHWFHHHEGLVLAGALLLAGAFQFSTLKDSCLTACRTPMTMLWQHYGRGTGSIWRLGVAHALSCLGCCWALMLIMFATGVGSLAWMLGLTAVMVLEKTAPWGHRLVVPTGLGLIAAGLVQVALTL
jgi:predicted metal-binding membrane protein